MAYQNNMLKNRHTLPYTVHTWTDTPQTEIAGIISEYAALSSSVNLINPW